MTLIILALVFFAIAYGIFKAYKTGRDEFVNSVFDDKDLPRKELIKLSRKFNIELYNLKKDEDGNIDRENYFYIKIARLVNKNVKFDFSDPDVESGEMDVVIELKDFHDDELKYEYMDIVGYITNFNFAQFVFKGDDMFGLFSSNSEIIDKIKDHADDIIHEVFLDVVKGYEENGSEDFSKIVGQALNGIM